MVNRSFLLLSVMTAVLVAQSDDGQGGKPSPIDDGEASITAKEISEHLAFLASDDMKGRAAGSEEAAKAAKYIAEHMEKYRLKPAGDAKSYENKFGLPGRVCRNVCGIVTGTDSNLRKDYLVFGAHYDHVGLGTYGSRTRRTGEVHNGADDNASGTSALLELMEAFAKKPPRRSILFLAFSGEELGLVGSKAWVKKPTVPLRSITAMINLDMVGRSKDKYLFVGGLNTGTNFEKIIRKENEPFGFELELNGGGRGPSDFDSFYAQGVPVLFFFTAEHNEYHTPDDDVALINLPDLELVARLAYRTGRSIADGPRPKFQKDDRQAMPASSSRGVDQAKTLLGITLGQRSGDDTGVPITAVVDGGPAQRAGVFVDDRLLSVDGEAAESPSAVQSLLALKRPGTMIRLELQRKNKKVTLKIALKD